jgi:hypothetical protein
MNIYTDFQNQFSVRINTDNIFIIHTTKLNTNLYLFINNILIEDSISYEYIYYCAKLKCNDIITIKNNNNENLDLFNSDFYICNI